MMKSISNIQNEWLKKFDYSNNSGVTEWIEWSIASSILIELHQNIFWIEASNHNYPRLPGINELHEDQIHEYYNTFCIAKDLSIRLTIANAPNEYQGRHGIAEIANQLESFLIDQGFKAVFARYAGDTFVRISIPDALIFTNQST